MNNLLIGRSLLFCPAHVDRLLSRVHLRGADAIVLDLEDAVPPEQKAGARDGLAKSAKNAAVAGADIWVRVNADAMDEDLAALAGTGVRGVILPKTETPEQVQALTTSLSGSMQIIAQIESVHGLAQVDAIATASERLIGLSLGSEDFSISACMEPTDQTLYWPNQQIVFAARRAGIVPLGFPGSIAQYGDITAFRETVRSARAMGFDGALCIHPAQVAVLNEEFIPSEAEVAEARNQVAAYEQALAQGLGAAEYQGKMLDAPVISRARNLIDRWQHYQPRTGESGGPGSRNL